MNHRRLEWAGDLDSASAAAAAAHKANATTTILLVDDHPPNLMALEAILEPLGGRLLCASSGAEAVRIAQAEDLALILLDLQMPQLDGLETAALLKKNKRCHGVPIIIVTANEPTRAEVARGYATGAVDFLFKPLDPDVIRSKVAVFVALYEQAHPSPTASGVSSSSSVSNSSAGAPSKTRPKDDSGSGRLSDRLVAAASPTDQAATVEALIRLHAALTEDLDVANLEQRLVSEACLLTHAAGAAFHHRRQDGRIHTAMMGRLQPELAMLERTEILRPVFEGLGVVRCDDTAARSMNSIPPAIGSIVAVPLVTRMRTEDVEGVLVLVHEHPMAFDARDEELAIVAASHAATAFENARLYEEASQARHRAELTELELRANEARLRIAVDSAGLGTWDFNPMTCAFRWDARMKVLAGLNPDCDEDNANNNNIDYATFLRAIHPDDRERVDTAVKRALDPLTDTTFDCEYRFVGLEDGVERWVAARGQGIVEQARTVRFLGVTLDVTAKKRVEEERTALLASERHARTSAESASRAKDEFLATVSHELRNPLNAILGWSRVLLEEQEHHHKTTTNASSLSPHPDDSSSRVRKGLDVILRNAKAQVQLVEDILEVSRIVTGKLRLSTRPVDVRSIVEASIETMRTAAQAKRVTLSIDVVGDGGAATAALTMIADEDRVQQILWNLLSNAVKFTPPMGTVAVSASADKENESIVLTVTDSGEGIDPDFLPYVFDRFRQFDGSTTRTHGGLGLGLAIVRHLAELHGGTVQARSDGRGRGASFTVTLPMVPPSEDAKEIEPRDGDDDSPSRRAARLLAQETALKAPPPLKNRRVLILDDDPDMRDLLAMILEDAGATVTTAHTVKAALKAIHETPPDVAVSDLAMPGEDGYAFARQMRADESPPSVRNVPLIAMTAYARAEDRRAVLAGGFDRHVAKPIEPDELVDALADVINAKR